MSNAHAFHADLRLDGETIPVIIVADAEYSPGDRSVGESRGHVVTAAKFETSTKLQGPGRSYLLGRGTWCAEYRR